MRDHPAVDFFAFGIHQEQQNVLFVLVSDKLLQDIIRQMIIVDHLVGVVVFIEQIDAGDTGDHLQIQRLMLGQSRFHQRVQGSVQNRHAGQDGCEVHR